MWEHSWLCSDHFHELIHHVWLSIRLNNLILWHKTNWTDFSFILWRLGFILKTVWILISTIWIPETFECQTFEVRISNGWFMCYVLCTRLTIWILDKYIKTRWHPFVQYSNSIWIPDQIYYCCAHFYVT